MTPSTHRHMATLCPLRLDTLRIPSAGIGHRRFRPAHGNALAADFDIRKFGYPVVNCLGDVNWLIDGQHRVYAIQKAGVVGLLIRSSASSTRAFSSATWPTCSSAATGALR